MVKRKLSEIMRNKGSILAKLTSHVEEGPSMEQVIPVIAIADHVDQQSNSSKKDKCFPTVYEQGESLEDT